MTSSWVMVSPDISLHRGNYVVWAAVAWYAALGVVLVWLLAEPKRA